MNDLLYGCAGWMVYLVCMFAAGICLAWLAMDVFPILAIGIGWSLKCLINALRRRR